MNGTVRKWIAPVLYVLVPLLLVWILAQPMRDTVHRSENAAFLILLAARAATGLNWLVYRIIRGKRPSLPVFADGAFCLLMVTVILYEALPGYSAPRPTLAAIAGSLTLAVLLLLSFWFAARNTRVSRVIAVGMRIAVGVILFFMAYQIIRDFEIGNVTRETWITAGILVAAILGRNSPRICSALRRNTSQRRATGLAEGRIVQIVGETHLDLDDDPVTLNHARIQYTVDNTVYETRADISRHTIRKFGKAAFVGREIPVAYDPADPSKAFVSRIDKHFFDQPDSEASPSEDSR